jgi:hypothetical protein
MIVGRVIRILDKQTLVLSVGSEHGVENGMQFNIYSPSEQIIDPETGEDLGGYRQRKATVVARTPYPKFTIAVTPMRSRRVPPEDPLSRFAGRTEQVQEQLQVRDNEIEPIASGSGVGVGDQAEEVVQAKSPAARRPQGNQAESE